MRLKDESGGCVIKFLGVKANSFVSKSGEESKRLGQSSFLNIPDASRIGLSCHHMHLSAWGPPSHSGAGRGMCVVRGVGSSPRCHESEVNPSIE